MNFLPEKRGAVELILDVGNGSVGAGIAHMASSTPALLYGVRVALARQKAPSAARIFGEVCRGVSQALQFVLHEGFDRAGFRGRRPFIAETFVALSAPWIVQQSSVLRLDSPKPISVSESVLADLLKDDEKRNAPRGERVEQKLVKCELNGYPTSRPFGKRVQRAAFSVCSGFVSRQITDGVSRAVAACLHGGRISFHSFSMSVATVMRELFPERQDFLCMDVSGEQTEISVVKKGVLLETATFPFGRNHFIRSLGRAANAPHGGIAETFLALSSEEKGEGRLYERCRASFERARNIWLSHCIVAFRAFGEEWFLPREIICTADDDMRVPVAQALRGAEVSGFTLSFEPLAVTFVDGPFLAPFLKFNPAVPLDPFLAIGTLASHLLQSGRS